MLGDADRGLRVEMQLVDVILGVHAAERLLLRHAAVEPVAFAEPAIAGERAPRRRIDARRLARAGLQAEEEQWQAFLAAQLGDGAQRVLEQVRAQPAGVEQHRVVERIFEDDELRQLRLVLAEPHEPHQAIERADGAQKAVRDPMLRQPRGELPRPAVMKAGVGAAQEQNVHPTPAFLIPL